MNGSEASLIYIKQATMTKKKIVLASHTKFAKAMTEYPAYAIRIRFFVLADIQWIKWHSHLARFRLVKPFQNANYIHL